MVLGDEIRSSRRLQNLHPTEGPENSSESGESEDGIRVGEDHQAMIPECHPGLPVEENPDDVPVWIPSPRISDAKLEEFCAVARERHSYSEEQSLGMLYWHTHELEAAFDDMPNFVPSPAEWTLEDRVLFEQAFGFHGKSFRRIRQMLPDKSIASLVQHYYLWKKSRSRVSLMDKHARKQERTEDESDSSDLDLPRDLSSRCINCGGEPSHSCPKGALCEQCFEFWRRSGGVMRPSLLDKKGLRPPKGMYLSLDDLYWMASAPPGETDAAFTRMDEELTALKRKAQRHKQELSLIKQQLGEGVEGCRAPPMVIRPTPKWTHDEQLLAVLAFRQVGKDWQAVAELLGTKTDGQVSTFYQTQKARLHLDQLIQEAEEP